MELIPTGYFLYIMHSGVALLKGVVVSSGQCWGTDMILSKPQLRSRYLVLARLAALAVLATYLQLTCNLLTVFYCLLLLRLYP